MKSLGARSIVLGSVLCGCMTGAATAASAPSAWPGWDVFAGRFVQADGRVIDLTFDRKSTSEGQSYALFFALVANQRAQFDTLLRWTSDNLAAGQLGERLPAWLWGLRPDNSWGVKDQNSASDGDLWIAYDLLEAARLWHAPAYAATGRQLLAQISRQEIAVAGHADAYLLPGAVGFVLGHGRYRIVPSYMPGFLFRYLEVNDPGGPWARIWESYLRESPRIFAAGIAPDAFVVDSDANVIPDTEREPSASYDAIRVYLWAGMSGSGSQGLVRMLSPYAALIRAAGTPPEKVDPRTALAIPSSYSPIGYSGAVLPFLAALGDKPTLESQLDRVRSASTPSRWAAPTNYYDQVLILFGKGWTDGLFRFDDQGRLQPKWAQ
jgi:endoglucanase